MSSHADTHDHTGLIIILSNYFLNPKTGDFYTLDFEICSNLVFILILFGE